MGDDTYLFIDGGHLQALYRTTVTSLFGDSYRLCFHKIKGATHAKKVFYYDCADNEQRKGEAESDHKARVTAQNAYFDSIRNISGMHVRLGHLSGLDRRQKEVDVQLAVDMLTHSYRRNMARAVLISGDRDFVPVVRSLVELGTFIEVWSNSRRCAKELRDAADNYRNITITDLCEWTYFPPHEDSLRQEMFPSTIMASEPDGPIPHKLTQAFVELRKGHVTQTRKPLTLFKTRHPAVGQIAIHYIAVLSDHYWHRYGHKDVDLLTKYVEQREGPIEWE